MHALLVFNAGNGRIDELRLGSDRILVFENSQKRRREREREERLREEVETKPDGEAIGARAGGTKLD